MAPIRSSWRARRRRRATIAIGAAAVLLAQLGLVYVAGERYEAAIGRTLNPPTDVSSAEPSPVGPPLRVAGSRDPATAPTPATALEDRTVAVEPVLVALPPEPPPPTTEGDDNRRPREAPEPPDDGEPGVPPASDGGDREAPSDDPEHEPDDEDESDDEGGDETDDRRGRSVRQASQPDGCSTSLSERHDERHEACEDRGRDQRHERDESRVDDRGNEDEHRGSVEEDGGRPRGDKD